MLHIDTNCASLNPSLGHQRLDSKTSKSAKGHGNLSWHFVHPNKLATRGQLGVS